MEWNFQKIIKVEPRDNFTIYIEFEDGRCGIKDMSPLLQKGVFKPLQDPDFFNQVVLNEEIGAPSWPNGVDLAPDSLYENLLSQ